MALDLSRLHVPTLAEVAAQRRGKPLPKGTSRLDARIADTRDEKADERRWRKAVIAADTHICRCCKHKVIPQLALAANRLEVHHVAHRGDQAVRWDVRNGVVLCSACHQKITTHQIVILQAARYLFTVGTSMYLNARKPLTFKAAE